MDIIMPALVELALEHCEATPFERFAQTFVGSIVGTQFKPLGGVKDGGADGFVDCDIQEHVTRPTTFFQASKEIDTEGKIRRTINRLVEVERKPGNLYYATSRVVKDIDKLQADLTEELSCNIRVYDKNFIVQRINQNDLIKASFSQYLRPSVAFLEAGIAASYPLVEQSANIQQLSAFLGQETERRLGRTRALESICDALILWALEDTNPDTGVFHTDAEIVSKVEAVIPTVRQFFRGEVKRRLSHLSTKRDGKRAVMYNPKASGYCLPFESRELLKSHVLEDEALKLSVSACIGERLQNIKEIKIGENMLKTVVEAVHRTLERLFETQGFSVSRHFLEGVSDELQPLTITEMASEELEKRGAYRNKSKNMHLAVNKILGGMFYDSTELERRYLSRLARTYMLLFTIKNTPEVIEYFNSMAKNFYLYVGSDLIIRAISEYHLSSADQMTVNAFKILKAAGSRLVFTEQMLEEVHSHINASNQEYKNHYLEVDSIVDRELASQSDRILIRAYYYAKLDRELQNRPQNWMQFLDNFLTYSKIAGPISSESMQSLKNTICQRFGFEYEARNSIVKSLKPREITLLAKKLVEMKGAKREELAVNDAQLLLRTVQRRREREENSGNKYGFKTWYLTQDVKCKAAYITCFPGDKSSKYIMTPEFLLNYISYNPTSEEVKKSLATIFPSILGVRLGSRMPEKTLDNILLNIKQAYRVDPARASAIVAEHSDSLKSGSTHDFVMKYGSPT